MCYRHFFTGLMVSWSVRQRSTRDTIHDTLVNPMGCLVEISNLGPELSNFWIELKPLYLL